MSSNPTPAPASDTATPAVEAPVVATEPAPAVAASAGASSAPTLKASPRRQGKQPAQTTPPATAAVTATPAAAASEESAPAAAQQQASKKQPRKGKAAQQAASSLTATAGAQAKRPPRPRTATNDAAPSSSAPAPAAAAAPADAQAAAPAPAPVPVAPSTPSAPTRKPLAHRPAGSPLRALANASAASAASAEAGGSSTKEIIVLKVGSASLSADDCKLLHLSNICALVETICQLKQKGFDVVLVTSGAVAVGCQRLGLSERPKNLVTKQAVAAIGQSRLMRVYDDLFSAMSQPIAQVLLTRENLSSRHHYVNALNTFRELLRLGVVPIVNENDTVSIEELRVGDNDTLSARVASLLQAKWLFLLTDVSDEQAIAGLYDSDPRSNPSARIVHVVPDISALNVNLGSSGSIGTGGMTTKLVAASIATAAGVRTGIIKSTDLGHIQRMMDGQLVGTHFLPSKAPLRPHKKWIAHGLAPSGCVVLDGGASDAILAKKSLFASGVLGLTGEFKAGASVRLLRAQEAASSTAAAAQRAARIYEPADVANLRELGLCVVQYSSAELVRLAGAQSSAYASILGREDAPPELAKREDIVLTQASSPAVASPPPASNVSAQQAASSAGEADGPKSSANKKGNRRQKRGERQQVAQDPAASAAAATAPSS